jgi:hypothetical protein
MNITGKADLMESIVQVRNLSYMGDEWMYVVGPDNITYDVFTETYNSSFVEPAFFANDIKTSMEFYLNAPAAFGDLAVNKIYDAVRRTSIAQNPYWRQEMVSACRAYGRVYVNQTILSVSAILQQVPQEEFTQEDFQKYAHEYKVMSIYGSDTQKLEMYSKLAESELQKHVNADDKIDGDAKIKGLQALASQYFGSPDIPADIEAQVRSLPDWKPEEITQFLKPEWQNKLVGLYDPDKITDKTFAKAFRLIACNRAIFAEEEVRCAGPISKSDIPSFLGTRGSESVNVGADYLDQILSKIEAPLRVVMMHEAVARSTLAAFKAQWHALIDNFIAGAANPMTGQMTPQTIADSLKGLTTSDNGINLQAAVFDAVQSVKEGMAVQQSKGDLAAQLGVEDMAGKIGAAKAGVGEVLKFRYPYLANTHLANLNK